MRLGRYATAAAISLVFCVALAGCGAGGSQKKLLSYFPSDEGFTWEYAGTDDYAQIMGVDSIYKASSGEVTYGISGETVATVVDDEEEESEDDLELELEGFVDKPTEQSEPASGSSLDLDFGDQPEEPEIEEPAMRRKALEIEYEFSKDSVIERIIDADGLPHRFSQLEVLRTPIKKGKTWSFQTPDWTDVKAEIVETGEDAHKADYVRVKYEAEVDGSSYVETRLFKKGVGMVEFTASGPDGAEFAYSLIGK